MKALIVTQIIINLFFFYSDTICDLGGVNELANYGEYSGAPSEQQTYDYAKTILSLMTREKHPEGKRVVAITKLLSYEAACGGKKLNKSGLLLCLDLPGRAFNVLPPSE